MSAVVGLPCMQANVSVLYVGLISKLAGGCLVGPGIEVFRSRN